ncbi:hypothetical protein TrST_g632 [Triparma strigata]|uniref:Uncharacterized protein n=1 Tax=Triparma strigata TaxID=1606541 RepID=A0A9W7B515_9STRA|nr:hypothetical protein TrST_g632 [Triparma strigata]
MKSTLALSAILVPSALGQIVGYYSWNWSTGSKGPSGSTIGVAFTGLINTADAIAGYTPGASWCCPELDVEQPMLSLGGGNAAGQFTVDALSAIQKDLDLVTAANYTGIVFDVEEAIGSSEALISAFQTTFAAAKAKKLSVVITTSHSAPYATDTPSVAVDLVKSWCSDPNVDVISPQLYSSGMEATPETDETASCVDSGCTWDLYKDCLASFVPSIVDETHVAPMNSYFQSEQGMSTDGYLVWAQMV